MTPNCKLWIHVKYLKIEIWESILTSYLYVSVNIMVECNIQKLR